MAGHINALFARLEIVPTQESGLLKTTIVTTNTNTQQPHEVSAPISPTL